jgi:hypothetical protein
MKKKDQQFLEEAYQQIVEGRTLHTFEDWVKWIITVQKGQAVKA